MKVQKTYNEGDRTFYESINIDDRHAQLKDGSSLFLERNIVAHLKGNPDLALQAEALVS